jgi:hypothetical protein
MGWQSVVKPIDLGLIWDKRKSVLELILHKKAFISITCSYLLVLPQELTQHMLIASTVFLLELASEIASAMSVWLFTLNVYNLTERDCSEFRSINFQFYSRCTQHHILNSCHLRFSQSKILFWYFCCLSQAVLSLSSSVTSMAHFTSHQYLC